jgi:hypothetical protein
VWRNALKYRNLGGMHAYCLDAQELAELRAARRGAGNAREAHPLHAARCTLCFCSARLPAP